MVKEMTSNIDFYFAILTRLKKGEKPSEIYKSLGMKKPQNLVYYTQILRKLGFIKKENNIWIVLNSKKIDLEHALNWRDKKIRGHAFIWTIKPHRIYNWRLLLDKLEIKYNLVRGYIPRIMINGKKVWLGKKTITIYESKSFFGKNAIESRKYAIFELQQTINKLSNKLGITFNYYFKPVREHFGMIKNELARQCNKSGEKIFVRDTLDGEWLWIDDSESLGELETGGTGFTKDRTHLNMQVQNWYNDMKKHEFKVTPSFILQAMDGIQQNQIVFDKNMQSHIKAVQDLAKGVNELREEIKKFSKLGK